MYGSLPRLRPVAQQEFLNRGMNSRSFRQRRLELLPRRQSLQVAEETHADAVQALHERPDQVVVKGVDDCHAAVDEGDVVKGLPQEAFRVGRLTARRRRRGRFVGVGSRRCRTHCVLCYGQGEYSPWRPKTRGPENQVLENKPNRVCRFFADPGLARVNIHPAPQSGGVAGDFRMPIRKSMTRPLLSCDGVARVQLRR